MFLENVFTQQRRCGMTWSTPPASCRLHPQVGIYCCCTQVLTQTLVGQPLPSVVVDGLLDIGGFYHRQAAQHPGSMDECRMGGGEDMMGSNERIWSKEGSQWYALPNQRSTEDNQDQVDNSGWLVDLTAAHSHPFDQGSDRLSVRLAIPSCSSQAILLAAPLRWHRMAFMLISDPNPLRQRTCSMIT